MKTYKEDNYYLIGGNISNKSYSEIVKVSYNKISIKEGRVLVYKGRNTQGNYGQGEIVDDSVYPVTNTGLLNGFYGGLLMKINPLENYELTKSCGVYVKIDFSTTSGAATLIDIGYEDGSVVTSPIIYGLLSKKEYSFVNGGGFSYEVHETEPIDSDDESGTQLLNGGGYYGYFYIKIADIELSNGKFKIKQRHKGVIELSEPRIYFDAYGLTET